MRANGAEQRRTENPIFQGILEQWPVRRCSPLSAISRPLIRRSWVRVPARSRRSVARGRSGRPRNDTVSPPAAAVDAPPRIHAARLCGLLRRSLVPDRRRRAVPLQSFRFIGQSFIRCSQLFENEALLLVYCRLGRQARVLGAPSVRLHVLTHDTSLSYARTTVGHVVPLRQ